MCTALKFKTKDHYFGRNLDLDRTYGEEVCIMPRHYPLHFRKLGDREEHYAMIGMATLMEGIPLFYDACNEYGLAMAGLNFPGNAYYAPIMEGKENVASFELIPWILCQCKCMEEVRGLLSHMNLVDIPFASYLPPSPLHWMISDKECSIVVESRKDGLHIHDNPVGVLTNNPPFEYHLANLKKYEALRHDNLGVVRENNPDYESYCQGLGAVGLPGDVSSMSRFVRMVYHAKHSVCEEDELPSVGQFFHLLTSVEMVRGACKTDEGTFDITGYSACMNQDRGLYYYTTYGNRRISCVDMHKTNLDAEQICHYPLLVEESIQYQN